MIHINNEVPSSTRDGWESQRSVPVGASGSLGSSDIGNRPNVGVFLYPTTGQVSQSDNAGHVEITPAILRLLTHPEDQAKAPLSAYPENIRPELEKTRLTDTRAVGEVASALKNLDQEIISNLKERSGLGTHIGLSVGRVAVAIGNVARYFLADPEDWATRRLPSDYVSYGIGQKFRQRVETTPTEVAQDLYAKWPELIKALYGGVKDKIEQDVVPSSALDRLTQAATVKVRCFDGALRTDVMNPATYDSQTDEVLIDADKLLNHQELTYIEIATALILRMGGGDFRVVKNDDGKQRVVRTKTAFYEETDEEYLGPHSLSLAIAKHIAISALYGTDIQNFDPDQWPAEVHSLYKNADLDGLMRYDNLKTLDYLSRQNGARVLPGILIRDFFEDATDQATETARTGTDEGYILDDPTSFAEAKPLDVLEEVLDLVDEAVVRRLTLSRKLAQVVSLETLFKKQPEPTYEDHVAQAIQEDLAPLVTTETMLFDLKKVIFSPNAQGSLSADQEPVEPEINGWTHDGDTMELPIIEGPEILRRPALEQDLVAALTPEPVTFKHRVDIFIRRATRIINFLNKITTPTQTS